MKIYSFIAAIAISILLTSCTDDNNEIITKQTITTQKLDNNEMFSKVGDTIPEVGEPIPPKPKG